MKELERAREVFLTGVDEQTRTDNEEMILEWEQALYASEALASWQEHEVTRKVMAQAKQTYVDVSLRLAADRALTDAQRASLWAKQDAATWLLSLGSGDPKAERESVLRAIRTALSNV